MTRIIAESKGPKIFKRVWDSPNYHRYEMEHDGKKFILYFPRETDIGRYGPEELQVIVTVLDFSENEDVRETFGQKLLNQQRTERIRLFEQKQDAFRNAQLDLLEQIATNTARIMGNTTPPTKRKRATARKK